MIVIGIDPGKKGGVAIVSKNRASATPLPYIDKEVDTVKLIKLLKSVKNPVVIVERQWGRPGQSAVATSTTMFNYGKIVAAIESLGLRLLTPTPRDWQKVIIPKASRQETKTASIQYCKDNYPDVSLKPRRCRTDQDGLADALCIAAAAKHLLSQAYL